MGPKHLRRIEVTAVDLPRRLPARCHVQVRGRTALARLARPWRRPFGQTRRGNAQAQQQLRAPLFEDKVVDFVFELAQISETETDKDALKTAVEALEDE